MFFTNEIYHKVCFISIWQLSSIIYWLLICLNRMKNCSRLYIVVFRILQPHRKKCKSTIDCSLLSPAHVLLIGSCLWTLIQCATYSHSKLVQRHLYVGLWMHSSPVGPGVDYHWTELGLCGSAGLMYWYNGFPDIPWTYRALYVPIWLIDSGSYMFSEHCSTIR